MKEELRLLAVWEWKNIREVNFKDTEITEEKLLKCKVYLNKLTFYYLYFLTIL